MKGFFYGQTEYNYLENSISLEKYVEYCANFGYDFITITDTNMHGYYKFYNLCKKHNIKGIIGLKVNIDTESNILVYAKNDKGLITLFELSKKIEEKQKIELDDYYNRDIFFVIPDDNTIYNELINNNIEKATQYLSMLKGECYLGLSGKEDLNTILKFKETTNIELLPLMNCTYLEESDYNVYETLVKIGNKKEKSNVSHLKDLIQFNNQFNLYYNLFDFEFINNIKYEISNKVELPKYDNSIEDSSKYLYELADKGLKRRLTLLKKVNLYNVYYKRLVDELTIIKQMGYCDYFLIVWDLIKYSKKNHILVGPGRGSAAGSLVSYCLGITEIDPLEFNLFFERFLNPQRVSLPDIDIDFPDNKREEVIQYVKQRYGEDFVCYISAFNTFGIKSSVRDICRVNDINVDHVNLMLKYIDDFGIDSAIEKYSVREELLYVLNIAKKIEGLVRHVSTHAAGIILSNKSLSENIPLRVGINGIYQAQLEASDLEKMGYLKIDFLGIKNLTMLDNMVKYIENFNLNDIKYNDKKTFDILKKGDTNGVFQLESHGIKNVLKKMSVSSFNDIVSVLALYRPGPMDNIDLFISNKETKKIDYIIDDLKPILEETYGIIVYQEQIMQIANKIANYSLAEADILRRAVSKKNLEDLEKNRKMFNSRSLNNSYSEDVSNKIYDLIVKFANYGFNKSHSVAYAKLSYQMAYIKANYPIVFISEMINNCIGDAQELANYIAYAKTLGIEIVTPKINYSQLKCIIVKGKILLPFNIIKKIGSNIVDHIISQRESKYLSFDDFKERNSKILNESILNNLIYSGVFDEFKISKKNLISQLSDDNLFAKYVKDSIEVNDEYTFDELKLNEFNCFGFNINYNLFSNNITKINNIKNLSNQHDIVEGKKFKVVAAIDNIKTLNTKNNETMAFLDLDLNFNKMSAVVFPKQYKLLTKLDQNKLALVSGIVQKRNEELQLVINEIVNI